MKIRIKKEWFDNSVAALELAAFEEDKKLDKLDDGKKVKVPAYLLDVPEINVEYTYEILTNNTIGILIDDENLTGHILLQLSDTDLLNLFVQNDDIYLKIKSHLRQVLNRDKVYK